jgi:plasmid stabilization system protein ParE
MQLKNIFDYYSFRVSKKIAERIIQEIKEKSKSLVFQSFIGQEEEFLAHLNLGHRYILAGNYKIVYRIDKEYIYIVDIFDTRQNPTKMKG